MAFSDAVLRIVRRLARPGPGRRPSRGAPGTEHGDYTGDFTGVSTAIYGPRADGAADPGEVVWAWVPFEEDHAQGKDRPVLVVARTGPLLLALMLTSKDHDRDPSTDARRGRVWLDLGAGPWDHQGRPSEVRIDRVLQLDPATVRREGARLDRERFDEVAAALRVHCGWR